MIGILFDDVFEALFYHAIPVAMALIVFGVAFIIVERRNQQGNRRAKIQSLQEITFQTALLIGIFQLIAAIFPGNVAIGVQRLLARC